MTKIRFVLVGHVVKIKSKKKMEQYFSLAKRKPFNGIQNGHINVIVK
jgi:hypothetical protein